MPMTFKYRLATRRCVAPDVMFSPKQLEFIGDFLKRKDKTKAPATERKKIEAMLDRARIHGFEPDGFTAFGDINWLGIAENKEGTYKPKPYDPRGVGTIASVIVCGRCEKEFRDEHYEMDQPNRYCPKCALKVEAATKEDIRRAKISVEKTGKELP